jgi:hypothetical protein
LWLQRRGKTEILFGFSSPNGGRSPESRGQGCLRANRRGRWFLFPGGSRQIRRRNDKRQVIEIDGQSFAPHSVMSKGIAPEPPGNSHRILPALVSFHARQ